MEKNGKWAFIHLLVRCRELKILELIAINNSYENNSHENSALSLAFGRHSSQIQCNNRVVNITLQFPMIAYKLRKNEFKMA